MIKIKNKNGKLVEFECIPKVCMYNKDNFKAYGVEIDKEKYPDIVVSEKYNTASISGDIHDLQIGVLYTIKAYETQTKYGIGYKAINIRRDKPYNSKTIKLFLLEIITKKQVDSLLNAYPDIVDRVVNNRLDDIDLSKTPYIKEYTFNIIKKKIIENFVLVGLVDKFDGLISLSILKKLYDKYTSIEKIQKELKNNPYKCLCGLSRVGFKTADNILLEIDKISKENISQNKEPIINFDFDLKTSKQREKACILYLLEENENNGHTKIDVVELRKQNEKLTPSCLDYFVELIKDDEHIYYDNKSKFVAKKETYQLELYIYSRIKEGLTQNTKWDFNLEKYRCVGDSVLTDEQFGVLKNICEYNLSLLIGFAGSGKSMSTSAIIQMLKDNDLTFKIFAPTGRAAKVVAEYTNELATTIHRGLGHKPPNIWLYNESFKLDCDVLIIDESSMTDIFLFKRVLDAIDFSKTKILLVGDSAQLPSVSAGNILHDMVNSKKIPMVVLTKIFRYGVGGIMTAATNTRESKRFLDETMKSITFFGEDKGYIYLPNTQEKIINNLTLLYKKILETYKSEDIIVLSAYNKGEYGTIVVNNILQKIANSNSMIDKGVSCGETTFYENDLVMQIVNNYEATIYSHKDGVYGENTTFIANGEIGKILEIHSQKIIVEFDNKKIIYEKEMLTQLKLAYCISIHKIQGGNNKVIILLTPKAHTHFLNSNLIYVGITRAKEKCYHLGEVVTINKAIKVKADFNRKTFLKDFLLCIDNK